MGKIDRQIVYNKCGGKCGYCGCDITFKEMQVDHIISQFHYKFKIHKKYTDNEDKNHIDNLLPTCRVCNNWKSSHSLEQFRKEIEEQIRRLNDYSSNYRFCKKYNLVIENPHPIVFHFETLTPPKIDIKRE
jgi:5-methylcytosine-specific restriction endonuclease McrA